MTDGFITFLDQADRHHPDQRREAEHHLAKLWDGLDGSRDQGTTADKLLGRTEAMTWKSPHLRFRLERHGPAARGSIFAQVHYWLVDLVAMQASIELVARRQIAPKDKRLDIEPLVQRVAQAVVAGTPDPLVRPLADGRLRVEVGLVIPASGPKQTVEGRRRRFRNRLLESIGPHGWTSCPWPNLDRTGD